MSHSKTLLLVRHAKSSWKDESLADIERPLNKRGLCDAPMMGQRLAGRGLVPALIVASPAVRAATTARLIAAEVGYPPDQIDQREELYGAASREVMDVITLFDDQVAVAMIVGHNPTLTELANHFSAVAIENVPTCGILVVNIDHWSQIESAELIDFDYPKRQDIAR